MHACLAQQPVYLGLCASDLRTQLTAAQVDASQPYHVCGLQVKMLPADATLDEDALRGLLKSGHSRIPVHRPGSRYMSACHNRAFVLATRPNLTAWHTCHARGMQGLVAVDPQ